MSFATNTIPTAGALGKFGIAKPTGGYEFYATFQNAIDAANTGQTVELFTSVVETNDLEVNLKQGVTIQGNGHSYTLDNASLSSTIRATKVDVEMFNIRIKRKGGNGPAFSFSSDSLVNSYRLDFDGSIFSSELGRGGNLVSTGLHSRIYNLTAKGQTRGIVNQKNLLFNSNGEGVVEYGIDTRNGGKTFQSTAYSRDSYGHYVVLGGFIQECSGFSDGLDGLFVNQSFARNCYGESTARYGAFIGNDSQGHSVRGYSTANYGVYMINNAIGSDVKGESTISYGVALFSTINATLSVDKLSAIGNNAPGLFVNENAAQTNTFELTALNIRCNWDNAAGDAVYLQLGNGNVELLGGVLRVANAAAFCINDNGEGDDVSYLGLIYAGTNTPVRGSVNQDQNPLTTEDGFGNIRLNK